MLSQNYPNPFNPETIVEYTVPTHSEVTINIYNIKGQKVKTLVEGTVGAGVYRVLWDGRSDTGHKVSSGIYLYRFSADKYVESKKMILLK